MIGHVALLTHVHNDNKCMTCDQPDHVIRLLIMG